MSPGPTAYGKYELIELLARGGMAEVYKARSRGVEGFEKILVVKRILPELSGNARFVEMFINEAKIAVTLSHANIAQVFDLGRVDDTYFIAMEYVAGLDLGALLAQSRKLGLPIAPELAVYIASEVAKALDYAHRRRDSKMQPLHIVHRDVSPQNILISHEGEVKLTDFGVARAFGVIDAPGEGPKGKLLYMSPEQARGGEVDASSDLYSLGIVLYEMLAGRNPFASENVVDVLSRVESPNLRPLSEVNPGSSQDLSDFVERTTGAAKENRFSAASRLYEELIQFLFASGRRVGAHDLARYLDELRDANEQAAKEPAAPRVVAGIEAVQRTGAGVTAVESPLVRPNDRPAPSARTGSQGERAMATVMLVRFAAYDETPDSAVRSLIRRFGGTVSRRMIDGSDRLVAAVFGVGETTGRDAEAAARCALRIARLAESSASRVGEPSSRSVIHSTTLLLETDGKPIDAAVDAELSHAQELLQRARPGDVVASKHAERALRPFFHVELVDDGPVPLSRVLGERTVTEAFGRFVGRKEELKRIGEIFALANRGKRRTLLIHGDAGVGKSRLLHETIRRLRLGKHPVGMHLVSIPRDHVDVPLSGIREMLRTILGVDEFDPEPIIRRKVARLRELGLQPLEIRSVEANLGLRSESPERRSLGTLRSALANIARKLAEDTLTVLAFDGADHLDDESRTLIRHLVDDVRQSRLVVILTYRRPVRAPWEGVSRFYDFEVGPLSEEDLEELLTARFRTDGIERALVELVHRVTQANPRHAEEYVRALIERNAVLPVDDLARLAPDVDPKSVPSELRDLLRARLTAVDAADRRVLEMAALAGARSTAPVIAHALREDVTVVTRSLSLLEQLGVLVRRGASEYAVVGDLVGDLVLENVPEPTRREGHAALAEALEQLYPSRLEEFAERLAEHYRSGGSLEKSVNHWIRSADRLEAEGALDSAIGSVSRAIEILRELPSYDRELFLGLHARLGELSIRARATVLGISAVLRALDEAENVGRDDYFARYAMQLGRLHVLKHDYQRSREWLERARQSARNIGNRELLREVTLASAEANVRNGRFGEGVDLLEAALSLSRDTGNVQSQLRCLLTLAATYAAKGDKERALKVLEEAESILGVHPDRTTELEALTVESTIHFLSRNYTEALEAASRALELSKEYGLHDESAGVAYQVGLCQLHLGQFKAAFASFQSSQELARAHGQQKTEMASLRGLGFVDAFHFRNEGGRAQLEQALRFAEEQGYEGDVLEGKLMLALVDEHFGRKKDARRVLDEVLSLALLQGNARVRDDAESAIAALDAGTSIPFPV